MHPSALIGSTIFLYILAFIALMALGAYLTYRSTSKRHKLRDEDHNQR
ncbi:hypothetical protein RCH20_001570 [Psychrobacter sp. PL15]|nr:hypothetical protein [Psychrobacter sp. PL15]